MRSAWPIRVLPSRVWLDVILPPVTLLCGHKINHEENAAALRNRRRSGPTSDTMTPTVPMFMLGTAVKSTPRMRKYSWRNSSSVFRRMFFCAGGAGACQPVWISKAPSISRICLSQAAICFWKCR